MFKLYLTQCKTLIIQPRLTEIFLKTHNILCQNFNGFSKITREKREVVAQRTTQCPNKRSHDVLTQATPPEQRKIETTSCSTRADGEKCNCRCRRGSLDEKDTGFAGSVEAKHEDSHLLVAEDLGKQLAHSCGVLVAALRYQRTAPANTKNKTLRHTHKILAAYRDILSQCLASRLTNANRLTLDSTIRIQLMLADYCNLVLWSRETCFFKLAFEK